MIDPHVEAVLNKIAMARRHVEELNRHREGDPSEQQDMRHRLQGTWLLDPQQVEGRPSPYDGPLDVHGYCAQYIEALDMLEEVARLMEPN